MHRISADDLIQRRKLTVMTIAKTIETDRFFPAKVRPEHEWELPAHSHEYRHKRRERSHSDCIIQNRYDPKYEIGSGGFGVVILARDWNVDGQRQVAIKIIENCECAKQEVKILAKLNHRHVVTMLNFFERDKDAYIVQEFCEMGDMQRVLVGARGTILETDVKNYAIGIARGIKHIHDLRIVHRDIKMENILVNAAGEPKLADFGFALQLNAKNDYGTDICGTRDYLPPEMYNQYAFSLKPVDIWAYGVTVYIMLYRYMPYQTFERPTWKILNQQKNTPIPRNNRSMGANQFVFTVLTYDWTKRPNIEDILQLFESTWNNDTDDK